MSKKYFFFLLEQCRLKWNVTDKDDDKKSIEVESNCERVRDTLVREKDSKVPPCPLPCTPCTGLFCLVVNSGLALKAGRQQQELDLKHGLRR